MKNSIFFLLWIGINVGSWAVWIVLATSPASPFVQFPDVLSHVGLFLIGGGMAVCNGSCSNNNFRLPGMIWINKHKRVWRTAVNYINSQKAARCLVAWLLLGLSGLALISCSILLTALENAPQTREMALADLDGDGDLDAFLANGRKHESEPNSVLFNNGDGRFSNSGQRLSDDNTFSVALADLDNDGDTDALVGNVGAIGELFRNNGSGQFLSDGDVDAFIAATAMTHPASGETLIIDASGQVWFNQGGVQGGELGTFVDSGS